MRPDFIAVYKEHVWRVYAFLAYRLESRWEAEDLTQLTFERALAAWSRYDERLASPSTWLLAIARNALIDHQRRLGTRGSPEIPIDSVREADLPARAELEANLGLSPRLSDALERLSDQARMVLALRFGGDLATTEIAEMLELSVANVQQILSRSLRRLRAELSAADEHPGE